MKLFSVLPLYLAIFCVSVQSDNNLRQDAAGEAVLLATLQNIERILGPCPSGWMRFKSYCYLVNGSIQTWDKAQAHCKRLGGELVTINSAEENEFVLALARKLAPKVKQVWIGLRWDSSVKDYIWSDHSVPSYKNWAPHEPNSASELCGNMWTGHSGSRVRASGYWNDLMCGIHPQLPCGLVCKRLP